MNTRVASTKANPEAVSNLDALLLHSRWFNDIAPDVDIELALWLEDQGVEWQACENLVGPLENTSNRDS